MSSPDPFGDALARSRANAPPDPSDQDPFGTALSDAAGGRSFTTEETDYPREGFVAYADPKTGKVTYRRPKSDQVASAAAQRRDLAGSADVVATLAGGIVSGTVGGAGDILERAAGNNRGTIKGWIQRHATYTPQTPEGQQAFRELAATRPVQAVHKGLQALDTALGKIGPRTQQFGRDVGNIAGDVLSVAPAAGMLRSVGTAAKVGEVAAEAAPEAAASMEVPGTLSAARATTDLGGTTPELQAAVSDAKTAGKPINQEALDRHVEAETLPMPDGETPLRLRKGQATANEQQISDEKNLRADPDTQGILTDSISEQNRKLGASMGEIRRRATPEIVQRNNLEHGQAGVDAIKAVDNSLVLDTRAKYKALTDANGGVVPLDTGMAAANIDAQLAKGYLTKVAASDPAISEIMEALRSGKPISFEQFENARTGLAEVQRGRGSAGTAAGIVRKELESMPLTPEAQGLKGLADTARAAAKRRFDLIEENPAYKAAIEDNVPKDERGLHKIGAPSPLADTFMDRYFTGNGVNASRAYIERMKGLMASDPAFAQSVEAATLNKLRDAAGIDANGAGGFNYASYRNMRNGLDKKADVLMSPQSAAHTQQLSNVAGVVNFEGKASSINRSNTALTLQRYGAKFEKPPTVAGEVVSRAGDVAAAHVAGGPGIVAKSIGERFFKGKKAEAAAQSMRDAKLKFATDAVAPGAGITD